ncbi:hypothetical protein [Plebeiibacterium sediminum]|uniref:Uncharacterized protein n=1 Tax=Plebeiibacterium sediminum TaxID=2992112 RepID=A0AAE3SFL0_9BACT|nr:hypothetical protein [Plebeiobacterium sediminum]MCW3787590.1 hypothetical protein [Plebeiobacterium sediminum]
MKAFLLIVIILLNIGCKPIKEAQIIEGDLCYEWIKLGNFYGQPDSLLTNFYIWKDSIGYEGMMKEDSLSAYYLKLLEDNDLLVCPYVYIITDKRRRVLLYMNSAEYESLNHFTYKELIANHQKVRIVAKVHSLVDNMFVCKKLISVDVIDGVTRPGRSKFKIEDYR